jgi:SAM-dependent methyltransferase
VDLLIEATHRAELNHFWFRGFRRFVTHALDAAAGGRRDLCALDCGCGTGVNFRLLDRYGTTFGFDLNQRGLDFARQAGQTRLARASIAAIPFASGAFDLVTSFDVLQTLPDEVERAALDEFGRVLRPGGALVLTVAALDILFGNHSVLAEEVRRYSRRGLRTLVESAGFRIDRLTFTNTSLFPIVLAVRTAQRLAGLRPADRAEAEITVPPAIVNRPLDWLLAAEAAALRFVNMPVGSSLLCVARKP